VTIGFAGTVFHIFGLFVKPLEEEFAWSRTELSLVVSLSQVVYGLMQLVLGRILGRFGPRQVILGGLFTFTMGLFLCAGAQSFWQLQGAYGVIIALGYSGATINATSVMVSRWFTRGRGTAISIALAGFNAGQFALFPLVQYAILTWGWRAGFASLGGLTLLLPIPLALLWLRDNPRGGPRALAHEEIKRASRPSEGSPLRTRSFWCLAVSFWACGFSDFLLATHLPPFAVGVGVPSQTAGNALGFISGISVVGVLTLGALSDRVGRRWPLAGIYLMRALGLAILPGTQGTGRLMVFVVLYGFFYFASTPLTSATTADLFGPARLGTLYGYMVAAHGLGAMVGPLMAGVLFDAFGSYQLAFLMGAGVLFLAALCCAFIEEPRRG
jgi:MFS family permease